MAFRQRLPVFGVTSSLCTNWESASAMTMVVDAFGMRRRAIFGFPLISFALFPPPPEVLPLYEGRSSIAVSLPFSLAILNGVSPA